MHSPGRRPKRARSNVKSPKQLRTLMSFGELLAERTPHASYRQSPAGGYGLQDGGIVLSLENLRPNLDWQEVKSYLVDYLQRKDVVAYTGAVDDHRCAVLLNPFHGDSEILKVAEHTEFATLRRLDGLDLAAAIRSFPPHIQRLRERRAQEAARVKNS